jgi:Protein of unknown function (DUF3263)
MLRGVVERVTPGVGRPARPSAVAEPPVDAVTAGLDDWRAVLAFERAWSGSPNAKGRAVRASFGVSLTRYHQALDRALELPDALEHEPMLVLRLRRLRQARRARRTAGRQAAAPGEERRS